MFCTFAVHELICKQVIAEICEISNCTESNIKNLKAVKQYG